eukprot:scaffold49_cov409-Prasinococcus_capsulatus_cf.AAC.7
MLAERYPTRFRLEISTHGGLDTPRLDTREVGRATMASTRFSYEGERPSLILSAGQLLTRSCPGVRTHPGGVHSIGTAPASAPARLARVEALERRTSSPCADGAVHEVELAKLELHGAAHADKMGGGGPTRTPRKCMIYKDIATRVDGGRP